MLIGAVLLLTAATLLGGGLAVGFALRKLYKRHGSAFASWHKRHLLAGLELSIPVGAGFIGIAFWAGLQAAELFVIGAGLTWEAVVVWKRLRGRATRGALLSVGNFPDRQFDRAAPIIAILVAGLFIAAMVVDKSTSILGIARLVAATEIAVAAVFLGPITDRLYDGGVLQFTGFVPWDRFQSFRYVTFERTAMISFQFSTPGWLRKEIDVVVPLSEAEELTRWLAKKLPCIGVRD